MTWQFTAGIVGLRGRAAAAAINREFMVVTGEEKGFQTAEIKKAGSVPGLVSGKCTAREAYSAASSGSGTLPSLRSRPSRKRIMDSAASLPW